MPRITDILPQGEGTYRSCALRPKDNNCCARANKATVIGNPFFFRHEIAPAESYSGLQRDDFLGPAMNASDQAPVAFIRTSPHGCYFYQERQCTIYPVRPVICALFPFDLEEKDGDLYWIVYADLCPVPFNRTAHFENAKRVLQHSGLTKQQFVDSLRSAPMIDAPYIELERIDPDAFGGFTT